MPHSAGARICGEKKGACPTRHRCRARLYKRSIIAQNAVERDNFKFRAHKLACAARGCPKYLGKTPRAASPSANDP
jgi:hypothetical protein